MTKEMTLIERLEALKHNKSPLNPQEYAYETAVNMCIALVKQSLSSQETSPTSEPVGVDEQSTIGEFMLTDEQIKYMRDRFLGWKLPENFSPDGGISFTKKPYNHVNEPYGTNVFDAQQADQMIRYMLEGLPKATPNQVKVSLTDEDLLRAIRGAEISDAMKKPWVYTKWKDGIDVLVPTLELRKFAERILELSKDSL